MHPSPAVDDACAAEPIPASVPAPAPALPPALEDALLASPPGTADDDRLVEACLHAIVWRLLGASPLVTERPSSDATDSASPPGSCVELEGAGTAAGRRVRLRLDAAAVAMVLERTTPVRWPLIGLEASDVELGLLEHAVLESLAQLSEACPDQQWILAALERDRDVPDDDGAALAVVLDGRRGHAWLTLDGAPLRPRLDRAAAPPCLSIELPPIRLHPDDAADLAAGDVLLLPGADLEAIAGTCRLVAPSGWSAGRGRPGALGPDVVTVTPVAWGLEPGATREPDSVTVRLGAIPLDATDRAAWCPGAPRAIPLDPLAPARVHVAGRAHPATFVTAEGRLGLRLDVATESSR